MDAFNSILATIRVRGADYKYTAKKGLGNTHNASTSWTMICGMETF